MNDKNKSAPAKAALDEKKYAENLPEQLREIHDRFVGAKVLMLKDHPHADRVGMIDRMELAGALRKWGFIVRFDNNQYDEAFLFDAKHIQVIEKPKPKEAEKTGKSHQRKFEIYGKTRIIRDIRFDCEKQFEAFYKSHFIYVYRYGDGKSLGGEFSADCTAPDGSYIVSGAPARTIDEGIKTCLENIFYESKI